jgi:hypothetical protein
VLGRLRRITAPVQMSRTGTGAWCDQGFLRASRTACTWCGLAGLSSAFCQPSSTFDATRAMPYCRIMQFSCWLQPCMVEYLDANSETREVSTLEWFDVNLEFVNVLLQHVWARFAWTAKVE